MNTDRQTDRPTDRQTDRQTDRGDHVIEQAGKSEQARVLQVVDSPAHLHLQPHLHLPFFRRHGGKQGGSNGISVRR